MMEWLIFRLCDARRKALSVAIAEALRTFDSLGVRVVKAGPFGDPAGLFYLEVPARNVDKIRKLARYLGYTATIDLIQIVSSDTPGAATLARWRGRRYELERIYAVDPDELRDRSPDRREFVLPTDNGTRRVRGYRGDSRRMKRRALPVIDAKMLCNLISGPTVRRFLDPFAGAGGVVIEALRHGWEVVSVDIDPYVSHGLEFLGSKHAVADAQQLPFAPASFDAVATEPPYDPEAFHIVCGAMREIDRVIAPLGRIAFLIAEQHYPAVNNTSRLLSWNEELTERIDRKGTSVRVVSWRKPLAAVDLSGSNG
jgi:SAM-dependent methyltransferase